MRRSCWILVLVALIGGKAAYSQRFARSWWFDSLDPLPSFTMPPMVYPNPNASVPLAVFIEFATDLPVRARILVEDDGFGRVLFESAFVTTEHSYPILGLRPGMTEMVRVQIADLRGNLVEWPALPIVTAPLPVDFPTIEVSVSQPERMEPGMTLFNLTTPSRPRYGMMVAVNERGEVIWYYQSDKGIGDARRLQNGNIFFLDAAGGVEIDMLGNTLRRWRPDRPAIFEPDFPAIPIATDQLHHEAIELPNGNFLSLSLERRRMADYPSSETDPNASPVHSDVVGDLILEFRPDGTIVNQWSLLNILDPFRISFSSLSGTWNSTYPDSQLGTRDWSHGNAVIHDSSDDSMIVSLRHQDALVKIDRATGSLVWILGNHQGWGVPWNRYLLAPQGDLLWPFHQHSPTITPQGTLLLFDNGNFRRHPLEDLPDQNFSRAVEYSIDETNMTVSQVWSWGGPTDEVFFSGALGDADWLPLTGNVLITDGFRVTDAAPPDRWARIVEVTHTSPAEKVFEMNLKDAPGATLGWRVYRSERLPSLYPR